MREQVMREQDRLRVLQVGASGHDGRRMRAPPARRSRRSARQLAPRWCRRGRAGTAGSAWRSGRCGCDRRAACRRARRPTRSTSPRSSAKCTSSSVSSGRTRPVATPASRASSAASMPLSSSSVRIAGRGERRGVCPRTRDVVGRELPVEVRRPAQRGELGRRTIGEAAAPQRAGLARRSRTSCFDTMPYWPARSRRAEILLGSDQISMKPFASDWSNVSPVS